MSTLTTYRIGNIPYSYSKDEIVSLLERGGLVFDPKDLKVVKSDRFNARSAINAGYAFIAINGEEDAVKIRNIVDPVYSRRFEAVPYISKTS